MKNDDTHKPDPEALIKEAVEKNKAALFGSLRNLPIENFSPVGLSNVIKINSATRSGNVVGDNFHQRSDFILLGEDIEISLASSVKKVWEIFDQKDGAEVLKIVERSAGRKRIFRALSSETVGENSNVGPFVRRAFTVLKAEDSVAGKNAKQRQLRKVIYNLFTDQMRQDLGKVHDSSPLPQ
ncbi:hypothetical protein QC764_509762 [Podospora pseudoanserina]|uniref:Uncharacterized protein n=1 Tax=Podospora pseudoanserina TaxID=2609844 RepID=A0ABR0I7N3_9PEZI|nr:hypothetical protein QC764_509762 [Podospora pseudoanserina]